MPGKTRGRPLAQARISPEGSDAIDTRAQTERLDRSDMIRVMLAYAHERMPAGWRPHNWAPSTRKGKP